MPDRSENTELFKSSFIHIVVNAGNEDLAKKEIEVFYPELKLSFSKKGFLTFKSPVVLGPNQLPRLYFARRVSLGLDKGQLQDLRSKYQASGLPIQQFARDEMEPQNDGPSLRVGDQYIQLINTQDQEYWASSGEIKPWDVPTPGGILPNLLPEKSPSRTYLKAVSAVEHFHIPLKAGQNVLELGSSPGGTSYYLLNLGLNVWGVDPGEMAEQCLQFKQFHHLKLCSQEISHANLPISVDWLFCDMNLAPNVALKQTSRIAKMCLNRGLKGVIFTVKVPDTRFISKLPELIQSAKELFPWPIQTCQFDCHRSEFALVALVKDKKSN